MITTIEKLKKENDELRQKSNAKITEILESIADGFYSLDNKLNFVYLNSQAEDLFNLDKNIAIGKSLWDVVPKVYLNTVEAIFDDVINTKQPVTFETKIKGYEIWYETSVYPSNEGLSVYFREITIRKKVEKELRLSEERFQKAFKLSPDIMTLTYFDTGCYIDVSDSFLTTFAYSRCEVIGKKCHDLILSPSQREKLIEKIKRQGEILNEECDFRSKDGKQVILLLSEYVIELDGEKVILSSSKDITHIKHLEKEMSQLSKLRLVGQMSAGISHEIRNPMTTVRGFLQLLSDKEKYQSDREYFELMIDELDRANSIITEFLSLAQDKNIDLATNNIKSIVLTLHPLLNADAIKSDKIIVYELEDVPNFELDEKEIRQLIFNMVGNGLEATKSGGKVTIKTFFEATNVVLAIKDEGNGIPDEVKDKLGTPFVTTKDNGTGLGLSICYSIAHRHNAKIEFVSSSQGTTFFVKFKIQQ